MPNTTPETGGLCPDLLEILACPRCRGSLDLARRGLPDGTQLLGLACAACAVVYPVRDGIPVMLVEEAVPRARWDAGWK